MCSASFIICFNSDSFAREPFFRQIDVFESGSDGYDCFRNPVVVCNWHGMVIAFCVGQTERGENGGSDVVIKISSDNGVTWGVAEVIWDDGVNICGNPCPVYDRGSSTIWLFMSHNLASDTKSEIIRGSGTGTSRFGFQNCNSPETMSKKQAGLNRLTFLTRSKHRTGLGSQPARVSGYSLRAVVWLSPIIKEKGNDPTQESPPLSMGMPERDGR